MIRHALRLKEVGGSISDNHENTICATKSASPKVAPTVRGQHKEECVGIACDLSADVRLCGGAPGERLRQLVRACENHADRGAETILVLIRYPHGLGQVEEHMETIDAEVEVDALHAHARSVIDDSVVGLPVTMLPVEVAAFHRRHHAGRVEPVHTPLTGLNRQTDRAGQVGLAVTEAEWKDVDLAHNSGELYEDLAKVQSGLRDSYEDNEITPPARVLPTATNILRDDDARRHVMGDVDGVVIVDGEELLEVGRNYLGALTDETQLTLVVDQYAAVTRPVSETGTVLDNITVERCEEQSTEPEHVVKWLLGTETRMTPLPGPRAETTVVKGMSRSGQLDALARQIKQEHAKGTPYEEIVVYVKTKSDIPSVLDVIEGHDIPVISTSTAAFETDPVVREVQLLCAGARGNDHAIDELAERVPLGADSTEAILDWVRRVATDEGVAAGLNGWAEATQLLERIRGKVDPPLHEPDAEVTISETYSVYTLVREAAELLDTAMEYDGTFGELGDFTRITSDSNSGRSYGAQDVEYADDALRVDTMRAAKGRTTDVAIAVDLVDNRFEGVLDVPTMFSDPEDNQQYPAVTDVERTEFTSTFPEATVPQARLTDKYHQHLNHRLLGLVVRSADERLFLGTYEFEDSGRQALPIPVVQELAMSSSVSTVEAVDFAGSAEPTIAASIASSLDDLRDEEQRYDLQALAQARAKLEQAAHDSDQDRRTRAIISAVNNRVVPTPNAETDDSEQNHE